MIGAFGRIVLEALVVLLLGLGFALVANEVSPRRLSLTRDYFARTDISSGSGTNRVDASTNTASPASADLRARLELKGLSLIEGDAVEKLFRDPQYEQELIVFVDARDDRHYQEGHIPGAYQFDRYYPERYLPSVLPACLGATRVVVYCTGGKCEDSEFAAGTLVEAGVPAANISVYEGGIADWTAHKRPIETGARKSGVLRVQ